MGDDEGRALIAELIAAATRPESAYRHAWRAGDVLMWDNRATMHRCRPWPAGEARVMVRTTVQAIEADGLAELRPAA
jgi:alpha-ketoglutarate-dependent 2,4-dichlorophenoxyacetate dioxygenase